MSQEKAQLIAPIGHFTVPGLNVSGVVTATSFSGDCTGTASSIVKGTNVVVGVMTASSFVGDVTGNVTGIGSNTDNLDVGIVTATSFAGNFTGIGSGLTGTPNVVAGVVTATKFVGNTPGTVSKLSDGTNINVGVVTATKFVGNTSGLAAGIAAAQNINVGVLTATGGLYGDGSGLTGAGSTAYIRQTVTASVSAAINLNLGNVIYFVHDANATVSFANTTTATDVTIIRTLTDNTITWPSGITWNGGSPPTLAGANDYSLAGQVFNLVTCDGGTTWYGYEEVSNTNKQPYELYSWGFNYAGQLGQNEAGGANGKSSPVQIPGTTWEKLGKTSGGRTSLVIKNDNTLWAWGWNNYGEIGNNTRNTPANTGYSSPVQIPGTTWKEVSVSDFSVGAVKTDGTLWVWGANDEGTLAQNDTVHRSSPTQIPGTTWNTVVSSEHKMFGIKTNGTLWGWGNNQFGGLGQNQGLNDQYNYSSPVQIPGTTWNKSFASNFCSFATKTDGTLWTWGNNSYGELGHNNRTKYSSPVQVPGTNWSTLSNSYSQVNAIKTDGTLWAWGENTSGQLGQNNLVKYSSPVQVGSDTTWSKNAFGHKFSAAIKTDGTLWVCGANANGQLGQNSATVYSSPVQIPGTTWYDIDAGYWRALAIKRV